MRNRTSQKKRDREATERAQRSIERERAQRASKARAEFVTATRTGRNNLR
jgi:hypothetical protein